MRTMFVIDVDTKTRQAIFTKLSETGMEKVYTEEYTGAPQFWGAWSEPDNIEKTLANILEELKNGR